MDIGTTTAELTSTSPEGTSPPSPTQNPENQGAKQDIAEHKPNGQQDNFEKPDRDNRDTNEIITAIKQGKGDNPDNVLAAIAAEPPKKPTNEKKPQKKESQNEAMSVRMQKRELEYLLRFPENKRRELENRYNDERSGKNFVQAEITRFAQDRNISLDKTPDELRGILFKDDTANLTEQAILQIVDQFFNNEKAIRNPEKHALVTTLIKKHLELLREAQSKGEIPEDLTAEDVFKLISEDIAALAFQDRAASENLLGDHGVRHISYNINACLAIADCLKNKGAQITAMDQLLMIQIMIYHDIGYAMTPVREPINKEGIRGQDIGHNLLGARYVRELITDSSNIRQKIFGNNGRSLENLDILHRGILYHDKDEDGKTSIKFVITPEDKDSEQSRLTNIESIIRTADNTHAFEDKLPELLYRIPETIKYMRLMKTAAEIGDKTSFLELRRELAQKIRENPELSPDDRDALILALMGQGNEDGNDSEKGLRPESYNFTITRICGTKPKFSFDNNRLAITVTESAIHQEVVKLFGLESYRQLLKFITDLGGSIPEKLDPNTTELITENLIIRLQIGEQKAKEVSDYQRMIEDLLNADPDFVAFSNNDTPLSLVQNALESSLELYTKGEIEIPRLLEAVSPFVVLSETDSNIIKIIEIVQRRIEEIKGQRRQLFENYRKPPK